MKAVSYRTTGPSSVLELGERPEPHPGPGEVRVRIHVSGVNPTDWKSRSGGGRVTELGAPQVPNQDGAGVVDEVGPGVGGFAVGDRVWVWDAAYQRPDGTAQELVVLPARQVVPLPDDVELRRRRLARHPGTDRAHRAHRVRTVTARARAGSARGLDRARRGRRGCGRACGDPARRLGGCHRDHDGEQPGEG